MEVGDFVILVTCFIGLAIEAMWSFGEYLVIKVDKFFYDRCVKRLIKENRLKPLENPLLYE